MRDHFLLFFLVVSLLMFPLSVSAGETPTPPTQLLQFTAGLNRVQAPGAASVTFAVYRDQEGGSPLWTETQSVEVDEKGRFTVVLGALQRIPLEIFNSGEARWLGIQRIPEAEQSRILLAAVPYALKASDADTLGGKPLSAFVLADSGGAIDGAGQPRRGQLPVAVTQSPATLFGKSRLFRPKTNESIIFGPAATGFQLASISGNTSVGFATTNGEWQVYLKPSSTTGFDVSEMVLKVSADQLTMYGSITGESSAFNVPAIKGTALGTTGLSFGVYGEGGVNAATNYGVSGHGEEFGVFGSNTSLNTIHAGVGGQGSVSSGGVGVRGMAYYGVRGVSNAATAGGSGVYGEGEFGVYGSAIGTTGAVYGVYGDGADTTAVNVGVLGVGGEWGVRGLSTSTGGAAIGGRAPGGSDLILMHGIDTNDPEFRVTNTGSVQADGSYTTPAADLAERIDVTEELEPGDVVEIDPDADGHFRLSSSARSTLVAGVVSTQPGFLLNDRTLSTKSNDDRPKLALAGQVPVKVTAENGAIRPGDLLVASSKPGRAMHADANAAPGTVIGKALERLESGEGTIRMLVLFR